MLRQLPSARLPTVRLRDTRWRSLAFQYAFVNAVAILIWAVSGADVGDFWPKWVFVVTLILFARRTLGHRGRRRLPPAGRGSR